MRAAYLLCLLALIPCSGCGESGAESPQTLAPRALSAAAFKVYEDLTAGDKFAVRIEYAGQESLADVRFTCQIKCGSGISMAGTGFQAAWRPGEAVTMPIGTRKVVITDGLEQVEFKATGMLADVPVTYQRTWDEAHPTTN